MLQNLKTKYVGFESLKSVIWWALSSEDIYIYLLYETHKHQQQIMVHVLIKSLCDPYYIPIEDKKVSKRYISHKNRYEIKKK